MTITRDLGQMGESIFEHWCSGAGLVANKSKIDKTGWDFHVEFPSSLSPLFVDMHKSALECRVQVKSTDKKKRKLSIPISNLRRLVTALLPAFFVIIEFDGKSAAQRVFVVHVGEELIFRTLKKMHEISQSEGPVKFNKRSLTISYDKSHMLKHLDGDSLKERFVRHIGNDVAVYVSGKKDFLESAGYEDGYAKIKFEAKDLNNIEDLIDVSLGIKGKVSVSSFAMVNTRFGISSFSPVVQCVSATLEMPNLKPDAVGIVRFKENNLSHGLSFKAKLYNSAFNLYAPDSLKKIRIEGDCFNIIFSPYLKRATYSFTLKNDINLDLDIIRDSVKLVKLISTSGKKINAELIFDKYPKTICEIGCDSKAYNYSDLLNMLDSALKLRSYFEVSGAVKSTLDDLLAHSKDICQMCKIVDSSDNMFKVEFSVDKSGLDVSKKIVCIFLLYVPVGEYIFGLLISIIGYASINIDDKFELISYNSFVEQKIVFNRYSSVPKSSIVDAIEMVEGKYADDCIVVTLIDKSV